MWWDYRPGAPGGEGEGGRQGGEARPCPRSQSSLDVYHFELHILTCSELL